MELNGYMILITQSGDGELKLLGKLDYRHSFPMCAFSPVVTAATLLAATVDLPSLH